MIVTVVVLLAALSSVSTQSQFEATSEQFNAQLQASARELGQSVSHTLALTSATSLRDNNFSFLGEVAQAIVQQNENILRVQMVDADGLLVADTETGAKLGEASRALRSSGACPPPSSAIRRSSSSRSPSTTAAARGRDWRS